MYPPRNTPPKINLWVIEHDLSLKVVPRAILSTEPRQVSARSRRVPSSVRAIGRHRFRQALDFGASRLPALRGHTRAGDEHSPSKKKAAWFPRRPFLSHGGLTLAGDFRTAAPGAYLPAASYSEAAARRGSRDLLPDTDAMVSHLRKMSY